MDDHNVHARELQHHEELYSGFAQKHFAKPAVRAFRLHLAGRIRRLTKAAPSTQLLSLGCGIGDTELLLATHVGRLVGVDLSPLAIQQARVDAAKARVSNVEFLAGSLDALDLPAGSFNAIIAIFFLHHLPDEELERVAAQVRRLLSPGGVFYSLDPSRYRLSGAIGKLLVPNLMKKYQSADERELAPAALQRIFERNGLSARTQIYDFLSTPAAGLFPSSSGLYRATRWIDEILMRTPLLSRLGSNFELIAHVRR